MKKLINISLYLCALCFLVGCEGLYNPQVPDLSKFGDQSAIQIYQESEAAFQDKQYNQAIRGFKALNRLHHNNIHAQAAYITLIECYLALNQFEDATQTVDTLIRLYPNRIDLSKLHYKKQMIHIALIEYHAKQRCFQDAIKEINRFMRLYPNSRRIRALRHAKEVFRHRQEIQDIKSQYETTLAVYSIDKIFSEIEHRNTKARYREEIRNMRRDFDERTRRQETRSNSRTW